MQYFIDVDDTVPQKVVVHKDGPRGIYFRRAGPHEREKPQPDTSRDASVFFGDQEYENVLEGKRKAFVSLKSEERMVTLDKDLAKMQLLSSKKSDEDIFLKLRVHLPLLW
ncbi:hyaluronan/mRNA-binding protein [Tanacetum coccineum]|uniref:Hyaluronan/mRNA-binding protein n=1 Tax=Tanacetum coccineum TaxID=301880 RepID=A0ABQ5GNB8_9ASTR